MAVRTADVQSVGGARTGVYTLGYRLSAIGGGPGLGPFAVLRQDAIPLQSVAKRLYTAASTRHRFLTRFWYRITDRSPTNDGFLHTETLPPGRYRLTVTAGDARGNVTSRSYGVGVGGGG